ncbi:MAG: lyase family protein [Gammaproteobacteria bacterium]|nr:lyase family protein [Gammaproteobacteria bacterium]
MERPHLHRPFRSSLGTHCLLGLLVVGAGSTFANTSTCSAARYTVSSDYPGAAFDTCVATNDTLTLYIQPEDDPPINPSPWYGFRIDRTPGVQEFALQIELVYPEDYKHRYIPKTSLDSKKWDHLPASSVSVDGNGNASFVLRVASDVVYVSAQENLNLEWYADWLAELVEAWPGSEPEVIGYSLARHPIEVLETNPNAPNLVLLLGRVHPPEVPGTIAMRNFVDAMASIRIEGCNQGMSPTCKLFQRYNFMILPLLNPDGVVLGHWRHNLGSTDLNRDWGPFTQPETVAVRDKLASVGATDRLRLMLDFHSTNRDVLYVQEEQDVTNPPNFADRWLRNADLRMARNDSSEGSIGYEFAPRPRSDQGTSKNYFYSTYGIPSITFETGDNSNRASLPLRMDAFARSMIELLQAIPADSDSQMSSDRDICNYTYSREIPCEDFYCFLVEANKATLLSLTADGLMAQSKAAKYSSALLEVLVAADADESLRASDYLRLEDRLIEVAGVEVTHIHIGRSRQDLHGTVRRMIARNRWLDLFAQVQSVREELLTAATDHLDVVIPAYTHGVPSQPTTFGHQLLAYHDSFARLASRMREGFHRLNRSPYGAGAGTTSSFPLDRERLAALLGFDSPVENSYDANFIDSMEYKGELASLVSSAATTINQFVSNVHSQQRDPWPWLYLGESGVSGSSSMPQKRNPRDLDRLRTVSNDVLSLAHRLKLNSHNVDAGMHDYRMASNVTDLSDSAMDMLRRFGNLVGELVVDSDRALNAIDRSFATSTQVADLLVRTTGMSFRDAHGFAASLVDLARSTERKLRSIREEEIADLYQAQFHTPLPLPISDIHAALESSTMVFGRKGLGGPQIAETTRMLKAGRARLRDDDIWFQKEVTAIISADIALQDAFFRLCSASE